MTQLFIKCLTGDTIPLDLDLTDPNFKIIDLKEKINEGLAKKGKPIIPIANQRIFNKGRLLPNLTSVREMNKEDRLDTQNSAFIMVQAPRELEENVEYVYYAVSQNFYNNEDTSTSQQKFFEHAVPIDFNNTNDTALNTIYDLWQTRRIKNQQNIINPAQKTDNFRGNNALLSLIAIKKDDIEYDGVHVTHNGDYCTLRAADAWEGDIDFVPLTYAFSPEQVVKLQPTTNSQANTCIYQFRKFLDSKKDTSSLKVTSKDSSNSNITNKASIKSEEKAQVPVNYEFEEKNFGILRGFIIEEIGYAVEGMQPKELEAFIQSLAQLPKIQSNDPEIRATLETLKQGIENPLSIMRDMDKSQRTKAIAYGKVVLEEQILELKKILNPNLAREEVKVAQPQQSIQSKKPEEKAQNNNAQSNRPQPCDQKGFVEYFKKITEGVRSKNGISSEDYWKILQADTQDRWVILFNQEQQKVQMANKAKQSPSKPQETLAESSNFAIEVPFLQFSVETKSIREKLPNNPSASVYFNSLSFEEQKAYMQKFKATTPKNNQSANNNQMNGRVEQATKLEQPKIFPTNTTQLPKNQANVNSGLNAEVNKQKVAKLLKLCNDYLPHLLEEVQEHYPGIDAKTVLTIKPNQYKSCELKEDPIFKLTLEKCQAVAGMTKILTSNDSDSEKLGIFKQLFNRDRLLLEQRRDSKAMTFLKVVSTLLFGLGYVLGFWDVKGADLTEEMEKIISDKEQEESVDFCC